MRFTVFTACLPRWKVTRELHGYSPTSSAIVWLTNRATGFGLHLRTTLRPGRIVDLLCQPDTAIGRVAAGSVHHIAFRAKDDAEQLLWREYLVDLGYNVTPVIDRTYFHSIYFREPGGVLFEIATEPPGFMLDEKLDELGMHLRVPPWMESSKSEIEKILPPIRVPL